MYLNRNVFVSEEKFLFLGGYEAESSLTTLIILGIIQKKKFQKHEFPENYLCYTNKDLVLCVGC